MPDSRLRIFVVEDEMTIALMIEDMLTDLGHRVTGVAMRLPQATEMAKDVEADVAILDINLDGRRSFPVAQMLRDRGVKLLFASGYGSPGLEAPFLEETIIKKPFEANDLKRAIARVAA
ncbi:MAG TPA: response regulator [Hyphomonadaceae bacterium]|nr:response regulator [Hyphomonadaceae bacterium]